MRLKDFTRRIDFDAIYDRLDRLQGKLGELRDALPEYRSLRRRLPSYRDVRERLPYAKPRRGYTLPAALVLGGIAALGAIAITSLVLRDVHRQTPTKREYMV